MKLNIINKCHHFLLLFLFLFLHQILHSQAQPGTYGFPCSPNTTTSTYPCQTYVYFTPQPYLPDLASIGDLFGLSRLSISNPSNISNPSSPLLPNQPLFVPISCGCNSVQNKTLNFISFANISYTIKKDDTFYYVSTHLFGNLTTYESVEAVNPTLVPENLTIGSNVNFPIFCKCPSKTQLQNRVNFLVSYVFQSGDSLDSVASKFRVSKQSIVDVNRDDIKPLETVFVPIAKLPQLNQPNGVFPGIPPPAAAVTPVSVRKDNNKGAVVGLGLGFGICALLLVLVSGCWIYREARFRRRVEKGVVKEEKLEKGGGSYRDEIEQNLLLADVSDTLDKFKVYEIDELKKATDGFNERCLIQGSVYKGQIDGKVFAVKKMKWNAYEELKILQKVNHGNLVRLEGFSIDPEDASCYLVYEYIENGSLYSWLHEHHQKRGKLKWKTRLRIAIDIANGLQYIHEHTRPQVVHKDIKSTNILLDSNMRAKIANFGLAKSGCNAITMHIVGTQGYIAPEYLTDGVVSPKMDIFAFGVVLMELITGREAVDENGRVVWMSAREVWDEGEDRERMRRLMEWVDESLVKESCSGESLMSVMAIAIACVNKDSLKRPSMVDVVYALCKNDDFFFDISSSDFTSSPIKAR